LVGGPWKARIGWSGFSRLGTGRRRQNTGTTPVGTYSITQGFGISANPGKMPWTQVTSKQWWPYDPRDPLTYNRLQQKRLPGARWRKGGDWSEHLISYGRQYSYALVINFNTARPVDTSAGGGIFLHANGSGATAGCVSVSKRHVKAIARWLRPQAQPKISMGVG